MGPQGPPGVSGYEIVAGDVPLPDNTPEKSATARCPAGKVVIGGGYSFSDTPDAVIVRINAPRVDGYHYWDIIAQRITGTSEWTVRSYALCATAP
jgi:hypothetical protein